ncbi:MAG: ABC transporter permease [Acidisphaera sp.]|nr:ABC transporter permease [Acidisphaera sp.]
MALLVPSLVLLTFLLFACVTGVLGSPAAMMLGQDATPEAIERIDQQYGFDRPIVMQYVGWLQRAVHGDFGRSYATRQPVAAMLTTAIPVTLELSAWSILLAVSAALILNSIVWARGILGPVTALLAIVGITVPNFILGTGLIYLLSVRLHWLPTTGWVPWSEGARTHLVHLIMPVLTLSAFYFGSYSMVYRAQYRATYRQAYIRVAQAKGLSDTRVSFRHALPNSVLPVITYLGISLGQLMGGAVVTENVFSIPGIGGLFVNAIGSYDFPVMLVIGMIILAAVTVMNIAVDIAYTIVNPQLRT